MTREIKRGGPFPGPREEAQLLGPYPTWDSWKRQVFERFPEFAKNGSENLLKGFYEARRSSQKIHLKTGVVDTTPVKNFLHETKVKDPTFFTKCREPITFILENTEIETSPKGRR